MARSCNSRSECLSLFCRIHRPGVLLVTWGGVSVVRQLQPGDPQTIGPYRLVGRLGQGGMGQVFLGVSPGGRPVAVKAIRAELAGDPEFRMRFGREVAAARRVSGVFTAMVVDADTEGPVAWLATAYVPGPSLTEAVEGHGPLPEASLVALAGGLAESLKAIHAAGVVHRDLKPSNVLLAEDGPRVIDFGISRAAESTALTQAGLVVGSPGFMSPEQAMGGDVGPPSDIFNLGAVLTFAATGQGPFGTGTTAALLYRVVHGTPSLDQVPATVRPLIERCLAKDPAQRPTADGLLAEVGALQPAGNWLPDSIIRTFAPDTGSGPGLAGPGTAPGSGVEPGSDLAATQTTAASSAAPVPTGDHQLPPAPAGRSPATSGSLPPPPGDAHRQPAAGVRNRPQRRWRPLVLAWVIGALLVAAGVTAFALTSFSGHAPTPDQSSSPAAPRSAGHTASGVSASPSPSQGVSSSASASSYAGTSQPTSASSSPSVYRSTSPTASASPSARTSSAPTSSSASASASAPASTSPSAATSASP
jgi:eukaryotic-like serine/threonine-protein kinase